MARTVVCKENNSGSSKHAGIAIVPEVCPVCLVRVWEGKAEDEDDEQDVGALEDEVGRR